MIHYIDINKPNEIDSTQVKSKIETLIISGVKTNDIHIIIHFVSSDKIIESISNKFRILKNRVALKVRPYEK